jgi:tetratricopeptide (TPR) repeat protein
MIQLQKICIPIICVAFASSGSVAAQQQNGKTVARIVFQEDVTSDASRQELQGKLDALKQETRQLQGFTRAIEPSANSGVQPNWQDQRLSVEAVLADLRPSKPELTTNSGQETTADIVERIELLERIYERKRIDDQKKISEAARLLAQTKPNPETPPGPATLPNQQQVVGLESATVSPPLSEQIDATASELVADRDFPNPVNLFELGNSLFQTGQLQTALEAYTQVDRNEISATEAVWLDFMIASCHRRAGNWDDAISLYREVANQDQAPNLTKPSQRWLKHLEMMSHSKSTFEKMETEISSLVETADKHVKK